MHPGIRRCDNELFSSPKWRSCKIWWPQAARISCFMLRGALWGTESLAEGAPLFDQYLMGAIICDGVGPQSSPRHPRQTNCSPAASHLLNLLISAVSNCCPSMQLHRGWCRRQETHRKSLDSATSGSRGKSGVQTSYPPRYNYLFLISDKVKMNVFRISFLQTHVGDKIWRVNQLNRDGELFGDNITLSSGAHELLMHFVGFLPKISSRPINSWPDLGHALQIIISPNQCWLLW